jgi:endoglycosylceramidase
MAAAALASGCGTAMNTPGSQEGAETTDALKGSGRDRLTLDGRFFRDGSGRAVILRGVNARVEGLFDVTFDDGRLPLEEVPELTAKDCKRMSELGFRIVRLPLNWSGMEPEKDVFDEAYFKRIDKAVRCFKNEGIYTLLDLHQDAYSKEIGEDGAPLWAIVPAPTELLGGPLGDTLSTRRLAPQTLAAFETFFAAGDPAGLQAQYIEMLQHLAKRYAKEDWVVGIDLFNEAFTFDPALLEPFNTAAAQAVRDVAPKMNVIFEPTGLWTYNGGEPVGTRKMPVGGTMYAPHLYEIVIFGTEEQLENISRADLEPVFARAAQEAKDFGKPWMIGEFGGGPNVTNYDKYLNFHFDLQDEYLLSSTIWLWKENSQDSWGLYDRVDNQWVERPDMVNIVSRPRAMRIAGTPTTMHFEDKTLTFSYEQALCEDNAVYVPERFNLDEVRCDGRIVRTRKSGRGVIEFGCGEGSAHQGVVTLK